MLKRLINRLLCYSGRHDWERVSEITLSVKPGAVNDIYCWRCKHCKAISNHTSSWMPDGTLVADFPKVKSDAT